MQTDKVVLCPPRGFDCGWSALAIKDVPEHEILKFGGEFLTRRSATIARNDYDRRFL